MITAQELFAKLKENKALLQRFEKESAATLKTLVSEELPEEQLAKLADGVQKLVLKNKMEAMIADSGLFPRA